MAGRLSAGILLYRLGDVGLEVLLAHPGGPFFARQDEGAWTIPKGEPSTDEEDATSASLLRIARREFEEETGHRLSDRDPIALGSISQRGGKAVHAWALEDDLDPDMAHSNTFEIEWPPRSGRVATFPEVDRVAWFGPEEARRRIRQAQVPLLDRLEAALEEARGQVSEAP
jgi:predicted NUDIX family NTP pyrophosphohydrolase